MVIQIDTELMRNMAALAMRATEAIDNSATHTYKVMQHDDWNCAERDYINEFIELNRNYQKRISEKIEFFSQSVNKVAQAFADAEISIPGMFGDVDAAVGAAAAIETERLDSGTSTNSLCGALAAEIQPTNSFEGYALSSVSNSLQVCNFDDIKF